jgi:hypothetical protein
LRRGERCDRRCERYCREDGPSFRTHDSGPRSVLRQEVASLSASARPKMTARSRSPEPRAPPLAAKRKILYFPPRRKSPARTYFRGRAPAR